MKWPNKMSYEWQPDGGVHVYKASGEGWYIDLKDLNSVISYAAALLAQVAEKENPLPYIGEYGRAYSSFEFKPDQLRAIHAACAKAGYLKHYTQNDLAQKLGVSRQAIHDRIKRGSLRSVIVDGHPVILELDLNEDERNKVAA